jgi:RNase H-like protein
MYWVMNSFTPSDIDALRQKGLSYTEIGAQFGITKDAARGLHSRWLRRVQNDASSTLASLRAESSNATWGDDVVDPAVRTVEPGPGRPGNPPRYVGFDIGYFDLEASGLVGTYGRLHLGACAHVDGSVWEARIDDPKYRNKRRPSDDGSLAVAIRDHLETHDIIVSWNGKRSYSAQGRGGFDVPMLNARLLNVGERLMDRFIEHLDLLKEARKHLQLHSYRLAAVQEFLELQEEKNAILPAVWHRAMDYDKDALDYVADHCRRDVLVLREVFEAFRRAKLLRRASR